ncbi:MAG: CheY-like receiver [Oscillospiraceae bacterium]|jgi:two-component system response regulator YcbB|nr:CheY-like receiver [Oscillospiraceae bacterium]
MRIYIIEDDPTVVAVLEGIIEGEDLGEVCGTTEDGHVDLAQIAACGPDLILIDLLMPDMDGIQVVRELKARQSSARFIMISQVSAKEMVAKAYEAGVEFFIHKPINLFEIKRVVGNVAQQIEQARTLSSIQNMLHAGLQGAAHTAPASREEVWRQRLKSILIQLGMAGEKGSKDIVELCVTLLRRRETVSQVGMRTLCAQQGSNPKSTEQRIRRAIERGLHHLASLGVEDYGNEVFIQYASRLFPFGEVRAEMARIQGKGPSGKVNLKKFIDGMVILAEEI